MRVLAEYRQTENAPQIYHRTPSSLKAVFCLDFNLPYGRAPACPSAKKRQPVT